MTTVTSIAVVAVARYSAVLRIRFAPVAMGMTPETAEDGVASGVRMTVRADVPLPPVFTSIDGEILTVVFESRPFPPVYAMAGLAIGRESGAPVIGISRVVKITMVTTDTLDALAVVDAVVVTSVAVLSDVRAG